MSTLKIQSPVMSAVGQVLKVCQELSPRHARPATKVRFSSEVSTVVIPEVQEYDKSKLWWAASDMSKFRQRVILQKTIKNQVVDMTLVITNNASKRKTLIGTTFGIIQPAEKKYVSCSHIKVPKALKGLNLKFKNIVIDGSDESERLDTQTLVQKMCPNAKVLTVYTDINNHVIHIEQM